MPVEHIKMPDIQPLVRYVATGAQTVFAYPFPIFASEDLNVRLDGVLQVSGFDIAGAGQTNGGTVTFDTAPAQDVVVTLERNLPYERLTDFLEGGDFSANAINTELDFLVGCTQQLDSNQQAMLRYDKNETPGTTQLPAKSVRANMVLGFDGNGDPAMMDPATTQAPPNFTASGTGAVTRNLTDKAQDFVSVKDFGAAGDGIADDTLAIAQALSAHKAVFLPRGTYRITASIELAQDQSLFGIGQDSVIHADDTTFEAVIVPSGFTTIRDLKIENGLAGIKLFGRDGDCVQNVISNVSIWDAATGILLDGYNDTNDPCYWNSLDNILIMRPTVHGVHLTKTGTGDTPNANRFTKVRVFSSGTAMSGSGFYIEYGQHNNSFVDCEANVDGSADSCFRIGADSLKTLVVNLYTESTALTPNVKLDSGSRETSLVNLHAQSDGAAILDNSGGDYDAFNAGFPDQNRMRQTRISDLTLEALNYDTEFLDAPGAATLSLSVADPVKLISAANGAITAELPDASTVPGAVVMIKKTDSSSNIVSVTEDGGNGPDGKTIQLGSQYDFVTVLSNGASWWIMAHNRMSGNTQFFDGSGVYQPDLTREAYFVSSFGGALEVRLPPANAQQAIGRTVTVKKTDSSSNNVTVTEEGGAGPDQNSVVLSSQYDAVTVMSNGGQWYILSRFP